MKYIVRVVIGGILTGAIIFVMARAAPWQDVRGALRALSVWNVAVVVCAVIAFSVLKATRFFIILRYAKIVISWRKTVQVFIASQAFTMLPAGEIARAMLFKDEIGVHLKEVAGPVFLQALVELWSATISVVFAAFFVGGTFGWLFPILFVMLAILSAPLLFVKQIPYLFDYLESRGITYAWIHKTRKTFHYFEQLVSSRGKTGAWTFWMLVVGLGISVYLLSGGLLWYVAHIEGAQILFIQGVFAAAMASLIQGVFVIIPGGIGVTEGGLVGILTGFAITWRKAIVITLLYRVATLPLLIVISLLFLLAMYGKKIFRYFI